MQLRDHPIFILHKFNNWWPPPWIRTGYSNKTLHGEVGVLVEAKYHERLPTRLFLRMEHEGGLYMGALVVDDASLCFQLYKFLQKHTGRTIKEIGDLEIDFFL